jgi:hypothetical protein
MNYLILGLIAVPFFLMKSLAQPVTYSATRVRVDSVQVMANRAPAVHQRVGCYQKSSEG